MSIQCENAVSARITYNYLAHPDDEAWNGSIFSNKPGVSVTTARLNEGSADCVPYEFTIVIPTVHWTGRYRTGVEYAVGAVYVQVLACGPIGLLTSNEYGDLNSYYGIGQEILCYCRGPYDPYRTDGDCAPLGNYHMPVPIGGVGNSYLYDTQHMRIEGVHAANGELPPCRFTVTDGDGLIYDRTEKDCPAVSVACEGYCAPGGSRIGDCCVNCDDLLGDLQAIRQAMRRL